MKRFLNEVTDRGGAVRGRRSRRCGRLSDGVQRLGETWSAERIGACNGFAEHDPEREDVAADIGGRALDLFRRHVSWRAGDERGDGLEVVEGDGRAVRWGGGPQPCQAEIEHLDVAVAPDHHVLRLDVAVHDPLVVGGGKRARDL